MIDKKGYILKDNEIFLERNFAKTDEPENVISIMEATTKLKSGAKSSITTAVRIDLKEAQECEPVYGCIPNEHHDYGPTNHKVTWANDYL